MTLLFSRLRILCSAGFILLLTAPDPAWAHKVILYAWVENGVIQTESRFASQRPAVDCPIIATDATGRVVHEGRTDDQGLHSFNIPAGLDTDLVLILKAGPGHQGEWRISREELVSTPSERAADPASAEHPPAGPPKPESDASPLKILSGIAIIFVLAWMGKKLIRRKKAGHD